MQKQRRLKTDAETRKRRESHGGSLCVSAALREIAVAVRVADQTAAKLPLSAAIFSSTDARSEASETNER
jgi:hypothetical protein